MDKLKKVFDEMDHMLVIYNKNKDKIWINSKVKDDLETNEKDFIKKFDFICKEHSFFDFLEKKENCKIILNKKNKKYYYSINFIDLEKSHLILEFKDETLLYEKDQLIQEAKYLDTLTQIHNRNYLVDYFYKKNCDKVLMFFDLREFKLINDIYGHNVGDEVLCVVASRIKNQLKNTDICIRFGGDEFVAVLNNISSDDLIEDIGKRIDFNVKKPILINGLEIYVEIDIGYVKYPKFNGTIERLIEYADIAMYHAKNQDSNIQGFSFELLAKFNDKKEKKILVEDIIKEENISIFYKKIEHLEEKYICGREVYFKNDSLKSGQIINIAKEYDLITSLDKLIIKKSLLTNASKKCLLFFEISYKSLFSDDFYKFIVDIINDNPLLLDKVVLDLKEKELVKNIKTYKSIHKFQELGVRIALDNYGLGELSVNDIHEFNFDIIKLGEKLVSNLEENISHKKLINTLINSFKNTNKKIIAKRIKTENDYLHLKNLGCFYGIRDFLINN